MKEFQPYPSWRDHADGREVLVNSPEEDAALGDGWKARGTEVPADDSDSPAGREADAAAASGDFQHYPSWRHHVDGRTCVVDSAEADAALGDGWHRDAAEAAAAAGAGATQGPAVTESEEETSRRAFHATPVKDVVAHLSGATVDDVEKLRVLRTWEEAHPKSPGGRKGVLEAIDDKLAELTAPAQ